MQTESGKRMSLDAIADLGSASPGETMRLTNPRCRTGIGVGFAAALLVLTAGPIQGREPLPPLPRLRYLEFDPAPELVTPETLIDKPRFPVVDAHSHFGPDDDVAEIRGSMRELGIRTAVNLSGGWGERLERNLRTFKDPYPDEFVIFCNVDFSRIDEPDFGRAAAAEIERAVAGGAQGLKIFKNLGLTVRDASGTVVPVDDPRLDPIWAQCAELGIPVLIHVGDPAAFFLPIDRFNERWEQLHRRPEWSFHGPEFPERGAILRQRDAVLERHPDTVFIGAHVGNHSEDLNYVASVLRRYPNFHVDISGRVAELGRQPYSARRFFIQHADRILFGTDRSPAARIQPRHRIYYRFLETDDEYFRYYDHPRPPTGDWRIYGLHLPDEVLEKVYFRNAERLIPGLGGGER